MRRSFHLLVAIMFGAVSAASAQAHAHLNVRLETRTGGPPNLIVQLVNLLDDPVWLEQLANASRIHVHWTAQLWRSAFLSRPQPPVEWDDIIWQVPVLDEFTHVEKTRTTTRSSRFGTLDSLKALVGAEVRLPTPVNLAAGTWYYTVGARITAESADLSPVQRFILGGTSIDLPPQQTAPFTVRP